MNYNFEKTAKSALDTFGNDALKSLLVETGFGNHPEIIRFMYRAGKAISEDSYIGNSEGADYSGNITCLESKKDCPYIQKIYVVI